MITMMLSTQVFHGRHWTALLASEDRVDTARRDGCVEDECEYYELYASYDSLGYSTPPE